MRRLECRQRTNSDVWILHVACKFRGFFHKPPTLYRYWEPIIYLKWQKQGSLSSFRPFTGWGLHRFLWKSHREYLKGSPIECYHFQPTSFLIGRYLKGKCKEVALDWSQIPTPIRKSKWRHFKISSWQVAITRSEYFPFYIWYEYIMSFNCTLIPAGFVCL